MHPRVPKPTLDPVSAGENIHVTGTGIPSYWIHMKFEKSSGGGESDIFSVDGDGNFRSLNAITQVDIDDKIIIRQSVHEFDGEDLQSDPVEYIVI